MSRQNRNAAHGTMVGAAIDVVVAVGLMASTRDRRSEKLLAKPHRRNIVRRHQPRRLLRISPEWIHCRPKPPRADRKPLSPLRCLREQARCGPHVHRDTRVWYRQVRTGRWSGKSPGKPCLIPPFPLSTTPRPTMRAMTHPSLMCRERIRNPRNPGGVIRGDALGGAAIDVSPCDQPTPW